MSPTKQAAHEALVTIVVPCYRGERYLGDALDSCARQTHRCIEVIVVDDASPDSCASIAEARCAVDSRFRLLRHAANGGVSAAFNTGFRASSGYYLTRLAQDDSWEPEAIERLVAAIEATDGYGLAYGDYSVVDERGTVIDIRRLPPARDALRWGNHLGLAVLWRRSVWDQIGMLDSALDAAEDYDYWLRAARVCRFVKCEGAPLLRVRVHAEMGTLRQAARQGAATIAAVAKWRAAAGWGEKLVAQRALSKAHLTAGLCYVDAMQPEKSLVEFWKALIGWPAPYGSADPFPKNRIRLLAAALRDTVVRLSSHA